MKSPFRKTASFVFALILAQSASANLVQDGNFTSIYYSGAKTITGQLYGQFGTDSATTPPATGATLTFRVGGVSTGALTWDTSGYNFVFTAGTVSSGTQTNGSAAQPFEAPGQFNVTAAVPANGYGSTYMWGTANGGASTITAPPGGGNFIAADGIFEVGAITQTITGLTVGNVYVLKFNWAGAQQQGAAFNLATTENWTVKMGTGALQASQTTATVATPAKGFSGWQSATLYFYATSTTEVLSFTAGGGPACEPPFALLANVDLEVAPDFSNWMIFTGFGALCIGFELLRRRRRRAESPAVA